MRRVAQVWGLIMADPYSVGIGRTLCWRSLVLEDFKEEPFPFGRVANTMNIYLNDGQFR